MRALTVAPLVFAVSVSPALAEDNCIPKISNDHNTSTAQMVIALDDLGEWSDDAFQVGVMAATKASCQKPESRVFGRTPTTLRGFAALNPLPVSG